MNNLKIRWGVQEIGLDVRGRRGDFVLVSSGSSVTILHGSPELEYSARLRVAGAFCMHDRAIRSVRYLRVSEPIQLTIPEVLREMGVEILDEEPEGEPRREIVDDSGTEDIPL